MEFPDAINRLEPGVVMAFARSLDLVGQQMESNLSAHVTADLAFSEKGDRVTDELAGLSEPQEVFHDWADSPDGHIDQFRRFAFYRTWNDGKYVGRRELAEKLVSPQNATTMAMGAGKARLRDERIMDVIMNPANVAKDDGTVESIALPNRQILGISENTHYKGKADGDAAPGPAPTCLTPAKLRAAKVRLKAGKIKSMERPKIAVEQQDLADMATSVEVTNKDYVTAKALEDGDITTAFGFDFVLVEDGTLRQPNSNSAYCPIWLKEQVIYRERSLVSTQIVQRADKMFRWYAYHEWQTSGLRRQDGGVVLVTVAR